MREIAYPVYLLGKNKPNTIEGVSFYSFYNEREDVEITKHRVVDDTNLPQESLALRRLVLRDQEVKLHKLNKAIFFLGDLIKLVKPNDWLIDSSGKIFNYVKSARVSLRCHEVSNVTAIPTGGAIIEIKGYSTRFKTLHYSNPKYAGILHQGMGLILYGLYEEPFKDTWRLI